MRNSDLALMRASFEQEFGDDADLDIDEFEDDGVDEPQASLTGAALDGEDDEDEDDAPVGRNANLSNRLPREDFAPVVHYDDRPPLIEQCQEILGDRLKITREGFFLDRLPAHTDKIVAAAGLKYLEDEAPLRSPPPRRPKRRRKSTL